jgi:hypothetical protein
LETLARLGSVSALRSCYGNLIFFERRNRYQKSMRHVDRNRFVLKGADKERVLAPIPTNPMMDYTSREYVIPLSRGHLPPCDHIKLEGIMLSRRASNKKKEEAPDPHATLPSNKTGDFPRRIRLRHAHFCPRKSKRLSVTNFVFISSRPLLLL